jgi:hypothetical protein
MTHHTSARGWRWRTERPSGISTHHAPTADLGTGHLSRPSDTQELRSTTQRRARKSGGKLRDWLSRSHSGLREIGGLAVLYALYELVRGAGGQDVDAAMRHTADIVDLERSLGIYVEPGVQQALEAIPYAPAVLGLLYVLLHFVGTAATLVWVHRYHSDQFPLVRTTFVAATALALIVYVVYPVAPPRLAGLGFSDTVTSSTGLDLSSDLLGPLYNPFAAVPSLHFGYGLIVAVALVTLAERSVFRIGGAMYPGAMLLVIVATGNHFLIDAALGGLVVAVGWLTARWLVALPKPREGSLELPFAERPTEGGGGAVESVESSPPDSARCECA